MHKSSTLSQAEVFGQLKAKKSDRAGCFSFEQNSE